MDTITHIVAGAAIGEGLMGKKVGKKAMLWGAIAANAPDIDAISNFFISDVDALVWHRGITHSVFTAIIFGPLLGWFLWKLYKQKDSGWTDWALLVTLNIFFHLFLDTCTVYGTGLLTPFSDYRYSYDVIYVADPVYTLPLLIGVLALLILPIQHRSRWKWNSAGLILSSLYLLFAFSNHHKAMRSVELAANENNLAAHDFIATPTLLNNLLWNVTAKVDSGYWIGYYSIFDHDKSPDLFFVPSNEELLANVSNPTDVQKLKTFGKNFYCVSEFENKKWFNVIRFGQVNGWENKQSKFALSFDLTPGADNSMVVQSGRIEATKEEVLASMWKRIQGN